MKYAITIIVLMLSFEINAQQEFSDAKIYLKDGKVIEGQLKTNFATFTDLKVFSNGKIQNTISKRKIDSIIIGQIKYIIKVDFLSANFLREIKKGTVSLYELDGRHLAIKRKNSHLIIILKNKYNFTYSLFCDSTFSKTPLTLSKDDFINKIGNYNQQATAGKETNNLFDSLITTSQIISTRLSFLRPELGFELKLSKGISFYNSIGINFYGNILRDAQTFMNYDYSSELRFYYNRENRLRKGKSVYNFSGPYLAPTFKYLIDINRKNTSNIGIIHGWQETVIYNLFSGYKLGMGVNPENGKLILMANLTMGWTF